MFSYFVCRMVESALLYYLVILFGIYAVIHFLIWNGLHRLPQPITDKLHSFSIVVAARNEEQNIRQCLEALANLNYPKELYEIIVVNDRSTDRTAAIVKEAAMQHPHIRCVDVVANMTDMPHKKNALRIGIEQSKNEIIACTDADCVVPSNWIGELSKQFMDTVGAVAGYSLYDFHNAPSLGKTFLRYEELKNSLGAAAGIGLKSAYMCTGRNFAYRRKVYDEIGGYEKIKHSVSGDDDLFIQLIQREKRWDIRYLTSPGSYVLTQPPNSLSQFIHQRTRHISASKYYPLKMKLLLGTVHVFNFSILVSLFFLPLTSLILFMAKINVDAVIIARGKELFNEEFTVIEFSVSELAYMLYNSFIGPLGFIKKFNWKGSQA